MLSFNICTFEEIDKRAEIFIPKKFCIKTYIGGADKNMRRINENMIQGTWYPGFAVLHVNSKECILKICVLQLNTPLYSCLVLCCRNWCTVSSA